MALADSVPGVSGGTIAFLLGFYDKFISSLDALIAGNKQERLDALFFLFKLGCGWIVGFLLAVSVLASIFDTKIYEISSLFMGFILFAIPIVIKEEKKYMSITIWNCIALVAGIALVALITYFNPIASNGTSINFAQMSIGLILYVFVAAMFSISAMALPGISGSTLLLIFGLYVPILTAIKSFISFDFSYFPILMVFGLGVITGIITIVRLIKYALDKHRAALVFAIIGMMIGSFYAIVMGPTTLEVPKDPLRFETFNILWFLAGGIIILGLQKMKIANEN